MLRIDSSVKVWRYKDDSEIEYEIIAVHEFGDHQYVWHSSGHGRDYPISVRTDVFLKYAEPAPDFFEEGKVYRHERTHNEVRVDKVIHAPSGRFALAIYMTETSFREIGDPRLLGEDSWSGWRKK